VKADTRPIGHRPISSCVVRPSRLGVTHRRTSGGSRPSKCVPKWDGGLPRSAPPWYSRVVRIPALCTAGGLALLLLAGRVDAWKSCHGGRFVLGTPQIVLGGLPVVAIVITGRQVAIEGICDAARGRLWRTSHNTKVMAHWHDCPGVRGTVRLTAAIGLDCRAMGGVLRARRERVASPFKAQIWQ